MERRSLLSLRQTIPDQLRLLGELAMNYATEPRRFTDRLTGTRVGLLFAAPSTRTRSSFWNAALDLGCATLHLGAEDLQVSTGETWADTGAVLANYLDVAVVRTNGPQTELQEFADTFPGTVNAVTHEEHPTQALADRSALVERFGSVEGLRIAYLGEVNNTTRSLAHLVCGTPDMKLDVHAPRGYGFGHDEVEALNHVAGRDAVHQYSAVPRAPEAVDAVYTTRWQSMGIRRIEPGWREDFAPFRVTEETMRLFSGRNEAAFMHDLPAVRDEEVSSTVLDGPLSLAATQARHKTSAAAAALLWASGIKI